MSYSVYIEIDQTTDGTARRPLSTTYGESSFAAVEHALERVAFSMVRQLDNPGIRFPISLILKTDSDVTVMNHWQIVAAYYCKLNETSYRHLIPENHRGQPTPSKSLSSRRSFIPLAAVE